MCPFGVHVAHHHRFPALFGHLFIKGGHAQLLAGQPVRKHHHGIVHGEGVAHVEGEVAWLLLGRKAVEVLVAGDAVLAGVCSCKQARLGAKGDARGGRGRFHKQPLGQFTAAKQSRNVRHAPLRQRLPQYIGAQTINVN